MPFFQVCGRMRTKRANTGCGTRFRTTSVGSVLPWKTWGQRETNSNSLLSRKCSAHALKFPILSHTHNTHRAFALTVSTVHSFAWLHTHSGRPDKEETTQTRIQCHQPSCRCVLRSEVQRWEAGKAQPRMMFSLFHHHVQLTHTHTHTFFCSTCWWP